MKVSSNAPPQSKSNLSLDDIIYVIGTCLSVSLVNLGNFLPNVQIQNSENIDLVSPYTIFFEQKIPGLGQANWATTYLKAKLRILKSKFLQW